MNRARVAVVGTGGTLLALGQDPFDLIDYDNSGRTTTAGDLLASDFRHEDDPEAYPVSFSAGPSTGFSFDDWQRLKVLCEELVFSDRTLSGIVIIHGTATLEETAYFLHLTLAVEVPVVVTGSLRPWNGLSSDGPANLRDAIRVAGCPEAAGRGVLVVVNGEIHCARDVGKRGTLSLGSFESALHGVLGWVEPARIVFHRTSTRRYAPKTEFCLRGLMPLPRVDVIYSCVSADGVLARAALEAGARGIVSAGFPPGIPTPMERGLLREASELGITVVQSCRAGIGSVPLTRQMLQDGFISADDLTPQKARILLALALTLTSDRNEIQQAFWEH